MTINNATVTVKTENKLLCQELEQIQTGDIELYRIRLKFDAEYSPKSYSIIWEEDQIDAIAIWHSKAGLDRNITPDWNMRRIDSRTASGMPLLSVYNKSGVNRLTISLSDVASPSSIMVGVVEENAKLRDEVRQLKSEKKKLRGQLAEEVIDSRINLATAMVMANEFGCDLEVYKKKAVGTR